jgi:uncharacterized membrane protein YeaQ/YmgE (transglycosylase-associated protein family)
MSLFAWIILGLVAGFIASHLVNHYGIGLVVDLLIGLVGTIVGGWLFRVLGYKGVTGLDPHSILVATVGAIVCLILYHAIRRRWLF